MRLLSAVRNADTIERHWWHAVAGWVVVRTRIGLDGDVIDISEISRRQRSYRNTVFAEPLPLPRWAAALRK